MGRKDFFEDLGSAKLAADKYANDDNALVRVYYSSANYYRLVFEGGKPGYSTWKLIYTADPSVITIKLTPEEAQHYQEYIGTERMVGLGSEAHFEGGMYQTDIEKSIFGKLRDALLR